MISSMTGFGRADAQFENLRIRIEIRSVNHRFLEVSVRAPKSLAGIEHKVQEMVQKKISRGKITLTINLEGDLGTPVSLKLDDALVSRYNELSQDLKTKHGISGDLDLKTLFSFPNILVRENDEMTDDSCWAMIKPPLEEALTAYLGMRAQEGAALATDLLNRITDINSAVDRVEVHVPEVVEKIKTRLQGRLTDISNDLEYNKFRLESEITIFADRSDVTEECVRLRSHCQQFQKSLEASKPAGRKLKFLLEEMHREVNTIGSKGQNTQISQEVIFMKEEVEKIREQVLNIE